MSKEHVIRQALRKELPVLSKGGRLTQTYLDAATAGPVKREVHLPGDAFDLTVNCVCKSCNETWLEREVEGPAGPMLGRLMRSEHFFLGKSEARILSLWAAKTAAVRAHMDKPPRSIPEEHYEHIMKVREPPPGTFVWLANAAPGTLITRHRRVRVVVEGEPDTRLHVTTIHYGCMALFVAGVSRPEGEYALDATIQRNDCSLALRLWPDPVTTYWPPASIDEGEVQRLSEFEVSAGVFSLDLPGVAS